MNREQAKELLPIISAFAEGKQIQINMGSSRNPNWTDFAVDGNIVWQGGGADTYRVKPEPRTLCVVFNCMGERLSSTFNKDEAERELRRMNRVGSNKPYTLVKFVEQL